MTSPTILNPVRSLRSAADTFLAAGQDSAAHFANRLADDAADMNALRPGWGDKLYRHYARQLIERSETLG
jgi:hypothetical protein